MKKIIALAFAILTSVALLTPTVQATERIGEQKQLVADPHGGRGNDRGGRGRRRGGSGFNFGFSFGSPGYYPGYRPGYYYGQPRRPVMVCDVFGSCWYEYR